MLLEALIDNGLSVQQPTYYGMSSDSLSQLSYSIVTQASMRLPLMNT